MKKIRHSFLSMFYNFFYCLAFFCRNWQAEWPYVFAHLPATNRTSRLTPAGKRANLPSFKKKKTPAAHAKQGLIIIFLLFRLSL